MRKFFIVYIFIILSSCTSTYYMSGNPQHLVKVEYRKASSKIHKQKKKYKRYVRRTHIEMKSTQKFKLNKQKYQKRFWHKYFWQNYE